MTETEVRATKGGAAFHRGPSWSPSKLNAAAECTAKYDFQYNLRPEIPPSANLAMGLWLDDVMNERWTRAMAGAPLDGKGLHDFAMQRWHERVEAPFAGIEWPLDTEAGEILARGMQAIEQHEETWGQTMRATEVQPWLEVPAGTVGHLRVLGRADLLTVDDVIVDYKFKGRGWYKAGEQADEKAVAELRRDVKMHLYAAAFMAKHGRPPKALRLIGLVWTTRPQVQAIEVRPTAQSIRWTLAAATGAAKLIEAGVYYPNPLARFCATCEYGAMCEAKYGAKQSHAGGAAGGGR